MLRNDPRSPPPPRLGLGLGLGVGFGFGLGLGRWAAHQGAAPAHLPNPNPILTLPAHQAAAARAHLVQQVQRLLPPLRLGARVQRRVERGQLHLEALG